MLENELGVNEFVEESNLYHAGELAPQGNFFMGVLGALVGAIIASIPWIIVSELTGFYVGYLGFLIGLGALYGFNLLKGKEHESKRWIILVSTVVGVVFATTIQYLLVFNKYGVPVTSETIQIFLQSDGVMQEVLTNLGMGLLIAFLGIRSLFKSL